MRGLLVSRYVLALSQQLQWVAQREAARRLGFGVFVVVRRLRDFQIVDDAFDAFDTLGDLDRQLLLVRVGHMTGQEYRSLIDLQVDLESAERTLALLSLDLLHNLLGDLRVVSPQPRRRKGRE